MKMHHERVMSSLVKVTNNLTPGKPPLPRRGRPAAPRKRVPQKAPGKREKAGPIHQKKDHRATGLLLETARLVLEGDRNLRRSRLPEPGQQPRNARLSEVSLRANSKPAEVGRFVGSDSIEPGQTRPAAIRRLRSECLSL